MPRMGVPPTSKPTAAGVLLIIGGLTSAGFWVFFMIAAPTLLQTVSGVDPEQVRSVLVVCGAIAIVLSVLMMIGGVFAFQRKMWAFALISSILGLFTVGFLFMGSLFALISLILIATSRREFP